MVNLFCMRLIMSSLLSSLLIVIIYTIRKSLKKHLSMQWKYGIWFLLFMILILPFVPESLLELGKLKGWNLQAYSNGLNTQVTTNGINIAGEQLVSNNSWMQDFSLSVSRSPVVAYFSIGFVSIWSIGVIGYALMTLFYNIKVYRIKQSIQPVRQREVVKQFNLCKKELRVRKQLVLGQSVEVHSPMVIGLVETYIILPTYMMEKLSSEELYFIFLHELTHYKKKDILINYVVCFFQIIYWFNPILYRAFKDMRVDREIACDTAVLQRIDPARYIDYGKTIINCAEQLSEMTSFMLVTGMGGSKKQIKKRIENIITFKHETKFMRVKSMFIFMLIGIMTWMEVLAVSTMTADQTQYDFREEQVRYEDLSEYFGEMDGSFVLYDLQADQYHIYNQQKSVRRVSPNSTYKIYSALFALESGVITLDDSMRRWDGQSYAYDSWNKDQDLGSAMKHSVTWYFQELDQLIGYKKLQAYFKQIEYGNSNLLGGIEDYWMESSLKISPVEQVRLLKALYTKVLPFQSQYIDRVKKALELSSKDGVTLSGKTGTGSINHKETNGWFIGYVEQEENTYIFATNIEGKEKVNGSLATQITLAILKDKNIYS